VKSTLIESTQSDESIALLKDRLEGTVGTIKELISLSLLEVKDNPSAETEILQTWAHSLQELDEYVFEETERTGTKGVYKNMIKAIMFKKF
jgi:hypothetical protein